MCSTQGCGDMVRQNGLYINRAPVIPDEFRPDESAAEIRLHELDLYVTMRCNLTCQFCSVRAGEYEHQDISLERCLSLVDEAKELGLQELHLLGGEPTLREDISVIIEHAAKLGIETRIITNGLLLDYDKISLLRDIGLVELMISVDGMAKSHNFLRNCGPNGWNRTMQCVDDAVRVGIRTRVATAAYEDNYDDVPLLLDEVNDRGVDRYSVFLGSPLGRGQNMLRSVISPNRWRALQNAVGLKTKNVRSGLSVIMEQGYAWSDEQPIDRAALRGRGTGCSTLLEDFDFLSIRSDGNVYQCVYFLTEGKPIGNVIDTDLRRMLQYARSKREYAEFTQPHDKCVRCSFVSECGTGCRGYAYIVTGEWLKADPRCHRLEPSDELRPTYFPLCPILKWNARTGIFGGSSDQALRE